MALVTAAAWFKLFPELAKTDELDAVDEPDEATTRLAIKEGAPAR